MFFGGCHGDDAKAMFAELCAVVAKTIELYAREGKKQPAPMTGRQLVNALQDIA